MKHTWMGIALVLASTATAQEVDRSKPPKLGDVPTVTVPAPSIFTLSNGLRIYHIQKDDVPLLQLNLSMPGGSAEENDSTLGLASMTAAMMMEGAGSRSSLELAEEIDYLGIALSTFSDYHRIGISLFTPTTRLDQALPLMADVVLRPTFPEDELARKKKQRLVSLVQAHDNPTTLATVSLMETLFGKTHPYGRMTMGDESTIRSLRRTDLLNFYKSYFVPENAVIISCGALSAADLKDRLEKVLGGWTGKARTPTAVADVKQVKGRRIILVDKPGAAQTVIRIGRIGVARLTPDYYALVVLNTLFGGSFTSRLNSNLREEHGYSYGAGSSFSFRPAKGPFLIGTSVQTDVTDKALKEIFKEIAGLKTITKAEVDKAKNYEALGYPSQFASVQSVVGMLSEKVLYGLPDSYFSDYTKNILAIDMRKVRRAADLSVDGSNLVIVLVGDRAAIEGPVSALKLGPITNLTHEDVLGKIPVLE